MADPTTAAWIAVGGGAIVALIGYVGTRTGFLTNRRTSIEQMALTRLESVEKQKAELEKALYEQRLKYDGLLEAERMQVDTLHAAIEELRRAAAVRNLTEENEELRAQIEVLKRQSLIGGVETQKERFEE